MAEVRAQPSEPAPDDVLPNGLFVEPHGSVRHRQSASVLRHQSGRESDGGVATGSGMRFSGTLRKRIHLLDRGRVDRLGGHVPRLRRARAAPPLGYRVKGLYALKPWYSRRLGLVVALAVRRGISPHVFTALGVLGAALAAVAVWQGWWPLALLLLAVRLGGANLDGAVARARGVSRPWGFVLNEVGDRVSDLLMYAGLSALAARVTGFVDVGLGRVDAARRARRAPCRRSPPWRPPGPVGRGATAARSARPSAAHWPCSRRRSPAGSAGWERSSCSGRS